METVVKADIFFFVATIAVAGLSLGLMIVLGYLIKVLRDLRYILERAREKTDEVLDVIEDIADDLRRKKVRYSVFIKFIKVFVGAFIFQNRKKKYYKKRKDYY